MIPYLARRLDIAMNNNAVPGDCKKTIVVPIYKGVRSVVGNYRPVSLTSVVGNQDKSGKRIVGYIRVSMVLDRSTHAKAK